MTVIEKFRELAHRYAAENIRRRHHLHANPELSYQEFETAAFVEKTLHNFGIGSVRMANTGVVAVIKGQAPESRIVALRADMDALPITEENDIEYKSLNPGIMHACGHDVHTTCLLGAAQILQETRNEWKGTVKLIFQPGEEKNPGGASYMIAAGVLRNPEPQRIMALHVHPGLQTGKMSFRAGMVMASADELYFTISGKGGHAAAPHATADTILAASQLVVALQQIASRHNNPFNPTVLSITCIQGGHTTNVIPSEVKMMGTLRCMDEAWRKQAHELIRDTCDAVSKQTGATCAVHIDVGYPAVKNDEALYAHTRQLAVQFLNEESNVEETELRMGAEDFGYYAQIIPACFFRLGVRNEEEGIIHGVHTPRFNIDERAIETGVAFMATLGALG